MPDFDMPDIESYKTIGHLQGTLRGFIYMMRKTNEEIIKAISQPGNIVSNLESISSEMERRISIVENQAFDGEKGDSIFEASGKITNKKIAAKLTAAGLKPPFTISSR